MEWPIETIHFIERTSPKGPGQIFIGTCLYCGKTNLSAGQAFESCPNPKQMRAFDLLGLTNEEKEILK